MSVYIQNFVKFKPFLKELVSRDVKVKYRRSILGVDVYKRQDRGCMIMRIRFLANMTN